MESSLSLEGESLRAALRRVRERRADPRRLLSTCSLDKAVQVYDRSTSKILATLKGHTKKVTAVVASSTLTDAGLPSYLISSSLDKSVRVWAPNGNKTVYGAIGNLALGAEVNGLALHPSGTLVASAQADGQWSIHDLPTDGSKPTTLLTGSLPADVEDGTSCTAIAFHPDGAIFGVGSSDAKIRIFDTPTGGCIASFEGHEGARAVTSLSFSENGYTLASSAVGSSQVKVWDLRKLANVANIEVGEGQVVNEVRFDESAQFLAVVGTDARVYQNKTWEELVRSEENGAELTGVRFASGGKEVVVAGVDRTVRVLSAPAAEE